MKWRKTETNPRIERVDPSKSGLIKNDVSAGNGWKIAFVIEPSPRRSWEQVFDEVCYARSVAGQTAYRYRLFRTPERRSYYGYVQGSWWRRIRRRLRRSGQLILEATCPPGKEHVMNVHAEAAQLVGITNEVFNGSREQLASYARVRDAEIARLSEALAELAERSKEERTRRKIFGRWFRLEESKAVPINPVANAQTTEWITSAGP